MIQDFTYALRVLVKTPGVSAIAIITLALGIGANSAIFSVIETVLLKPLPFSKPQELVAVWSKVKGESDRETNSFPDYADIREQSRTIDSLASYTLAGTILGTGNDAHELRGIAITSDIFHVLGVQPFLGRTYTPEEENKDSRVLVLTYDAWRRYFNSDSHIVGREVLCSLRPYTIIGVMPAGYQYPVGMALDYFMPLQPLVPDSVPNRGSHFLHLVGRLKPGVTVKQASAEIDTITSRLDKQYPDTNTGRTGFVVSLHNELVGDIRPALLTILASVVLVWLIACANVANLLLARATQRRREIAIRIALGASRFRIVRQLLVEGFLLALAGGCFGLLLAWWGIDLLRLFAPRNVPRIGQIQVDFVVIAFTLVASFLSTLLFATFPALHVSRSSVNESMQEGSRGAVGPESQRLRGVLVVAQVALTMLLLAGAGLLIKSFMNLRGTNPGFDTSRVVTLDFSLPRAKYSEPVAQKQFFERLNSQLSILSGVESAGGAMPLPFSGNDRASSFWIVGRPDPGLGNHPNASHLTIMGQYFKTMRIPFLAGRNFEAHDTTESAPVVIVNDAFVRKFFDGRNAVGQHITLDRSEKEELRPMEIVGVVGDSRHESLAIDPIPEFYVAFTQDPDRRMNIVLRTTNEKLAGVESSVRNVIREIDHDVYVPKIEPLQNLVGTTLAQPRFNMMLLGTFAAVAMILAAVGIYGVMTYNVAQRTKEIGIRMALGAQKGDMLRMILRQSLSIVGIGLCAGVVCALAVTRLMTALLYGVSAADLGTYVIVIFVLSGAALLASYLPARRAMNVDPMIALRYE